MKLFKRCSRLGRRVPAFLLWLVLGVLLHGGEATFGATVSTKMPVSPKWERFEAVFHSSSDYTNPLQQVRLRVVFTSPLGETNQVDGFWDGGSVWRVRFAPNQPGRWNYMTICSDVLDHGLHDQTGHFLCISPLGKSRFQQHGPVQVARDRRHLEHADHTPFFWLGDTVWSGAAISSTKDWQLYAYVRASQNFTVAQWAVVPGADERNESALTGFPEQIGINPDYFKRLDAKLQTLTGAEVLSAIAPLLELGTATNAVALPVDQAILLMRYVVARWGADPVTWLVVADGDRKQAERWKKIGREVFGNIDHSPVVLCAGHDPSMLEQFRNQPWVDVFSVQPVANNRDQDLKQAFTGPLANAWTNQPARPILQATPCENALIGQSHKRVTSDDVRHAAYWCQLLGPAAGLTYAGQGVINWDPTTEPTTDKTPGASLPFWHKALFMPAAKQVGTLAGLLSATYFWELRPQQNAVRTQPGDLSLQQQIVAAETEYKNLTLVYVPASRTLEVSVDALPSPPTVTWFNPHNAATSPAVGVVSGQTCQFPTPSEGDWLLVAQKGK
jgi:hypothetical protein